MDFEKGTFRTWDPLAMEGRLSLKVANVCTLVLDEDLPQAIPFMHNTVGRAELEMPKDALLHLTQS